MATFFFRAVAADGKVRNGSLPGGRLSAFGYWLLAVALARWWGGSQPARPGVHRRHTETQRITQEKAKGRRIPVATFLSVPSVSSVSSRFFLRFPLCLCVSVVNTPPPEAL